MYVCMYVYMCRYVCTYVCMICGTCYPAIHIHTYRSTYIHTNKQGLYMPCDPTNTASPLSQTLPPLSHKHCLPSLTNTASPLSQTLPPLSHKRTKTFSARELDRDISQSDSDSDSDSIEYNTQTQTQTQTHLIFGATQLRPSSSSTFCIY
jgi:hypothetical protein